MTMLARSTTWAWAAFLVMLVAFACAPEHQRFPAAPLSAFVFAAVLTCLPRCRPMVRTPLCPWNWGLLAFLVQLVLMPLLITIDEPRIGVLPYLPSSFSINMAMVINSFAFLAVCFTYNYFRRSRSTSTLGILNSVQTETRIPPRASAKWIGAFLVLGVIGTLLSFGSVGGVFGYFNDPGSYRELALDSSPTWRGLGGTLLKPFLGFALILAWCNWNDSAARRTSKLNRALLSLLMVLAVVLSFGLFNYNRGAFAVPLVAIAAVTLAKGDRVSWKMIVATGLVVLILSPLYAVYRSGSQLGEDLLAKSDLRDSLLENIHVSELLQVYAGAPQYLGYFLEGSRWGSYPHWGAITISSVLYPVPSLGKPFRAGSGFAIFNRMIYGTDAIADQNAPFVGETFLDLNIVGVLCGFAIFGWILSRLQQGFERNSCSLNLYIWQYLAIWACFVIFGSIEVPSQILIYYCWPIYAIWWSSRASSRGLWIRKIAVQGA